MRKDARLCPHCGKAIKGYRNPFPTVDIIIEIASGSYDPVSRGKKKGIVLIKRKNPPYGWALPGGFVDYGESLESAAQREAREETSLKVELKYQLGAYSDPPRDPRQHTISVVFVAGATENPGLQTMRKTPASLTPILFLNTWHLIMEGSSKTI